MRRHAVLFGLGRVLALPLSGTTVACGENGPVMGDEASCSTDASLAARPELEKALRGTVKIRDERDTTTPEGAMRLDLHRGRITASFGQVDAESLPATGIALSDACLGIVSRPTLGTETTTRSLERLRVDGTGLGLVDVPALGEGRYAYTGAPLVASASALVVEGFRGGFPGFSATLDAVDDLELLSPDPRAEAVLEPASPPLLEWVPGDGDAVFLDLSPVAPSGQPPIGGRVTCRVVDDGCFQVPEAVAIFLSSSDTDRFIVTVRRERVRVVPAEDAEVRVEASSSWRFDLVRAREDGP